MSKSQTPNLCVTGWLLVYHECFAMILFLDPLGRIFKNGSLALGNRYPGGI